MKRRMIIVAAICFLIGGIFASKCVQTGNSREESIKPFFAGDYSCDNGAELKIFDLQKFLQAKSLPIADNKDPGSNPPYNYFGILGNLEYPLKNVDITDDDEMAVIIKPGNNIKTDDFDAYMAYNTAVVKEVKNELCYFFASPGTTPDFYISIYKNGYAIEKDIGIFGAHLSKLGDEFKSLRRTDVMDPTIIASVRDCKGQTVGYRTDGDGHESSHSAR